MWPNYAILNAVVKSKYGFNLKNYVCVTTLIKSFDTDVKRKVAVFILSVNISQMGWVSLLSISLSKTGMGKGEGLLQL